MAIKLIAAEEELKLEKQKLKEKVLQIEQLTAEAEVGDVGYKRSDSFDFICFFRHLIFSSYFLSSS